MAAFPNRWSRVKKRSFEIHNQLLVKLRAWALYGGTSAHDRIYFPSVMKMPRDSEAEEWFFLGMSSLTQMRRACDRETSWTCRASDAHDLFVEREATP